MKHSLLLILLTISFIYSNAQDKPCNSYHLSAIESFEPVEKEDFIPFYVDQSSKALAVDAAKYKGDFALASYEFDKEKGAYQITINTISENDGESTYKLFINNKLISSVQNAPSDKHGVIQNLNFGDVNLEKGDVISVAFNSHTNGKIPEGETTAYSRGRWKDLKLTHKCN